MRAISVATVILDILIVLLGLILGFVMSVAAGMARGDQIGASAGPLPASQAYLIFGQGVGTAVLAILPSIVLLWFGKSRTALASALAPFILALGLLWPVRHIFY